MGMEHGRNIIALQTIAHRGGSYRDEGSGMMVIRMENSTSWHRINQADEPSSGP
jgi:hypothetical protein